MYCMYNHDHDPSDIWRDLAQSPWQTVEADLDEDDTPWHFEPFRRNPAIPIQFIKHAQWFVQQYWLECDSFYFMTTSKEMANVETLTITLRRSDFWNWEHLRPIGLDPRWPASVTQSRMRELWNKDLAGEIVKSHPEAWGSHMRNLKHLKQLTIELEGETTQDDDLKAIIEHAKQYWTFPHQSGEHMIYKAPIQTETWLGPPCMSARRRSFQRVSERPQLIKYSISFSLATEHRS
jgi:hypothetical protein